MPSQHPTLTHSPSPARKATAARRPLTSWGSSNRVRVARWGWIRCKLPSYRTLLLLSGASLALGIVVAIFQLAPAAVDSWIASAARFATGGSVWLIKNWDPYAENLEEREAREPFSDRCNVSDGRWVRDWSYPLWDWDRGRSMSRSLFEFPHLNQFNCSRSSHARYRWQPRRCTVPRFNASGVRARLRGRRLVFVGDSLGRNQFLSAVNMLAVGLSKDSVTSRGGAGVDRKHERTKSSKSAKWLVSVFHDHNFTVEYVRSHFLVSLQKWDSSKPHSGHSGLSTIAKVLDTNSVDKVIPEKLLGAGNLKSLIVVFNSGHWYDDDKVLKGIHFRIDGTLHPSVDVMTGFRVALSTLTPWIQKLQMKGAVAVWRTYAPRHYSGGTWDRAGACPETRPLTGLVGLEGDRDREEWVTLAHRFSSATRDALRGLRRPPMLLDVTQMSLLRPDGHVGRQSGNGNVSDCGHWCLPGVPDSWNELLFAQLVHHRRI